MDKKEKKDIQVIGVIPARYSSSRFEGKVLADINGKPMLQHVWEKAQQTLVLDDLIIACDDERVLRAAQGFGANAVLTSKEHACGTDRIIEVVNPLDVRIIINIQADEPLVQPVMIEMLGQTLLEDPSINMATIVKKIGDSREIADPHVVKVVIDKDNYALYFSRSPIPFQSDSSQVSQPVYYKHIGLYAYTKDFLFVYKNLPHSYLEKMEKLEQLRVLESGYKIKVIETKYETIGVDTPQDLDKLKEFMARNE